MWTWRCSFLGVEDVWPGWQAVCGDGQGAGCVGAAGRGCGQGSGKVPQPTRPPGPGTPGAAADSRSYWGTARGFQGREAKHLAQESRGRSGWGQGWGGWGLCGFWGQSQ